MLSRPLPSRPPTTLDTDIVSRVERTRALEFALMALGFAVALIVGTWFVGFLLQWDLRWAMVLWCVSAGLGVGMLLAIGILRTWGSIDRAENGRIMTQPVEMKEIETAPTALTLPYPTLPVQDDTFRLSVNGRGGEDVPKQTVHGFDPRDFEYVCKYLANGNKFTEAAMEHLPLPFSHELMGKAQGQTPYNRLMTVCVRAGVIQGRGGPGNPPGKLAITEYGAILNALKALPEE